VVTEDGPHPTVKVEPTAQQHTGVILGGRATSLPFTAVVSGSQRTTRDNAEAASTCAVRYIPQVTILPDPALEAGGRGGPRSQLGFIPTNDTDDSHAD
jgi:hypothetical protein